MPTVNQPAQVISVLVVEDVDAMRELVARVVQGVPGYTISGLARNTVEARIELSRRRPTLVLLDEVLPGESSLDFYEEIKDLGIAVVFITAHAGAERRPIPSRVLMRLIKPGWKSLPEDQERWKTALLQLAPEIVKNQTR